MVEAGGRTIRTPTMRPRAVMPRWLTVAAAVLGGTVTFCAGWAPLDVLFEDRVLAAVLEATQTTIVMAAAGLMYARFRLLSSSRRDLLLAGGFSLLAVANLGFSLLPLLVLGPRASVPWSWVALALRGGAGALIAAAAVLPSRTLDLPRWMVARLAGVLAMAVAAVAGLGVALATTPALPVASLLGYRPDRPLAPLLVTAPLLVAPVLVATGGMAVAAVGFTRQATREQDPLWSWFAVGTAMAAWAHASLLLHPSFFGSWVHAGNLVRFLAHLAIVAGAIYEGRRHLRRTVEAATLAERRRLAREIHDGLTQDLAYAAGRAEQLLARPEPASGDLLPLTVAVARALDGSRLAIDALTVPDERGLAEVIAWEAENAALRGRIDVQLDLSPFDGGDPSLELRQALLRIVGEAVTNAARHANAATVTVRLIERGGHTRLSIADDGCGFDPGSPSANGFGLTGMRERAAEIGWSFEVRSQPGAGTSVEVVSP
jgi:signal transduction histidine kinase